MIAFSGLAFLVQCATSGYCLWIYARNLWEAQSPGPSVGTARLGSSVTTASQVPTAPRNRLSSGSNRSARAWSMARMQAWKRVRKVIYLQWRSITLSFLVIVMAIYFATVFVTLNEAVAHGRMEYEDDKVQAWAVCLVSSNGDKDKCLSLAKELGLNEATVIASLMMAAVSLVEPAAGVED